MRKIDKKQVDFILSKELQLYRYYKINTFMALFFFVAFFTASMFLYHNEMLFAVLLFCAVLDGVILVYFAALFFDLLIRLKRLKNSSESLHYGVCVGKYPMVFWKGSGGIADIRSETDGEVYSITTDTESYEKIQVGSPVLMIDFGKILFIKRQKCYLLSEIEKT